MPANSVLESDPALGRSGDDPGPGQNRMLNAAIRSVKNVAKKALYSRAMMQAARAYTRRGIRILTYHRFPADHSGLEAQCEHIRRNYHPISMSQITNSLFAGACVPAGALAVTVDDGYHDFFLNALPIFSKYAIPVTIFLVTDFVDGEQWLWWDQLKYMFAYTRCVSLQFAGSEFNVQSDRKYTAHKVTEALKQMPYAEFLSQLAILRKQLEVEVPEHAPADYASLSWDEVRKLAAVGVEFGAHTRTHPILSKLTDADALWEEIAGSKKRLEEEVAAPSLHFSYPNGTYADYNEQTVAVVKRCGFATAVTAECGFNYPGADPFQLLRIGVEPSMPEPFFTQLLAGVRSHAKSGQYCSSHATPLRTALRTTSQGGQARKL